MGVGDDSLADNLNLLLPPLNQNTRNDFLTNSSSFRSLLPCLQAVQGIHELRIVHSDLKPANFLLVQGQLKLIDFGIAKSIAGDTTSISRESQVGWEDGARRKGTAGESCPYPCCVHFLLRLQPCNNCEGFDDCSLVTLSLFHDT